MGDNINWKVDVHDQRLENKDKFHHAFGSAILVQSIEFDHLSNISPQRDLRTTPVHCFLPSEADMLETKKNYVILISRLHSSFYLTLNNSRPFVKKTSASHAVSNKKKKHTLSQCQSCLEMNKYYQDVVHILEFYTNSIVEVYHQAGREVSEETTIHIGGDQFTRERFSGAKAMRAHDENPQDRFQILTPISFEFFHMQMNYLNMVFKILFNSSSVQELGTLRSFQNRLSRTKIGEI